MGAQLVVRSLSAAYGPNDIFGELDLVVAPGDVIGLVGPNGAGKSTLLRLLAGMDPAGSDAASSGSRSLAPPTATVGLLPQEPERVPGETVLDHLRRRSGVSGAQTELDRAAVALAEGDRGADDRYSAALERWLALGAADLDQRVDAALAEVGLDASAEQPMTTLSGGQAARAGLASLLLSRYDVLLLDEPTNDLDLAGLEQLERFVATSESGVVVVSHDREFLSRTVTRVLELDSAQRQINHYGGGFDAYLTERERDRRHARESYERYSDTVASLTERARTQRAWADKGVRAARRSSSDPDKFIKHHNVSSSEKQAAKARQTDRMLERLEVVHEPRKEWELQFSIAGAAPSGREVATLHDATVRRGEFTLGPVSLQVDRGDRIAITGANGSGKSTLLELILGTIDADSGTVVTGSGVHVGSIDQLRDQFLGDRALLDSFCEAAAPMRVSDARTLLAKFGLVGDHLGRPSTTLSPGERTRAALALLAAQGINVLVLDEPTNHLDLPAITQLESALDTYDATLLLVTHDRRLLEHVRVNRLLQVDAGRVEERTPVDG